MAAGAFALFTYLNDYAGYIKADYDVCVGALAERCPPYSVHLECGKTVAEWAAKECASYNTKGSSSVAGNACGYVVTKIECYQKHGRMRDAQALLFWSLFPVHQCRRISVRMTAVWTFEVGDSALFDFWFHLR